MKKAALLLIFILIALIILPGGTASWKDTLYMEGVIRSVGNNVDDEDEEEKSEESADNKKNQETVENFANETSQIEDKKSIFTITLAADPIDGGSVNSAGNYDEGKTVTITANPEKDYIFDGWFEAKAMVSKENIYTFTVDRNRSIYALFIKSEVLDPDIPSDEPKQEESSPPVS